jgi:hypothetical protein
LAAFLDAPLAISLGSHVPGSAVAGSLLIEPFERSRWPAILDLAAARDVPLSPEDFD